MFKKNIFVLVILGLLVLMPAHRLFSHCQVPCGIYDDHMRIKMIAEHITTMEKAMKQVIDLSKKNPVNYNQVVRWVMNKESHAEELSDIVTYYFMTQRLKPVPKTDAKKYGAYQMKLELLQHILFYAMKAKQTTDLSHIVTLRELLKKFEIAYFGHTHK
ncbi:MAG: superoxide dismutase [bacterium]|nr:superoxide dismutase [bacterium]